jgi:TonB family protein
MRLVVDGIEAYSTKDIKNPQGYVGLWARDGTAEFRDIQLQKLAPPVVADPPGVITEQTPGATIPKLIKEVKPFYTTAAVALKIQGAVWVKALVDERGGVADVTVVQSLDPEYGLDASAVAAAKQWRFRPATFDGKPARMAITIELAFTLK